MLRTILFVVAVLTSVTSATAGLRDQCLEIVNAVDDIGVLTCTAAIRENDQDSELYAARGRFYLQLREYDRAIADFNKARELRDKAEPLDDLLASAHLEKGDLDQAIALFDKIIAREPKGFYGFTKRGDAYRRKGDLNRALSDLNTSISQISAELSAREPGYLVLLALESNPHYFRGLVYNALQQPERAIADFTDAISRGENADWQTALILSQRGEAYLKTGAHAQALADADKAIELDAKSASQFDLRARVREAMGQKADAIQDYRRALSLDPKTTSSLKGLKRLGASP
jgi:tetratricopeptide (TPR) repeat protein